MPYVPKTWATGEVITAAGLNNIETGVTDAQFVLADWTPVLTASTSNPSVTYTHQYGVYVRSQRLLWVSFFIAWSARASAGTGVLQVSGLPAAPAFDVVAPGTAQQPLGMAGLGSFTYPAGYTSTALEARTGSSDLQFAFYGSGNVKMSADDSHLPASGSIQGTIIARVAAT